MCVFEVRDVEIMTAAILLSDVSVKEDEVSDSVDKNMQLK